MQRFIAGIDRFAKGLNRISAAIAALLLVYMLGHILFEIVLRTVFHSSTYVLDEFIGYAVAAMTFMGLGYALETGSLIRVDIIVSRLEAEARRQVEMAGVAATFVMTVFGAYWVGRDALRNLTMGRVSESIAEVPLWIPVGAVWLGLVLFAFQLAVYFLRLTQGGPVIGASEANGGAAADDAADGTAGEDVPPAPAPKPAEA